MIKLIADSGSTKTDWRVCKNGELVFETQTQGINPYHQSEEQIDSIITEVAIQTSGYQIKSIEFYGAGCALPEKQAIVYNPLSQKFPKATISVNSDLLGAAKAVCGSSPGIVCILGTGSNSCEFDGSKILKNVSPLGYILGDEGSGAVLGRQLLSDCLKNQLPTSVSDAFWKEYKFTPTEIIERIYRQPMANRFLATFTPFLAKYRHETAIRNILLNGFRAFFTRNVMQYNTDLPVHFVGSVAFYFQQEINEVMSELSLSPGQVIKTPIEGLVAIK